MVADERCLHRQHGRKHELARSRDGEPRWTRPTQGGRLAAVSATKLYLRSYNLDLFMMDRKTGRMLVDPGETSLAPGLKLRDYDLDIVNRFNDRIYFATTSGMIVCLRETGKLSLVCSRTPKPIRLATYRRKGSSRRRRRSARRGGACGRAEGAGGPRGQRKPRGRRKDKEPSRRDPSN